MDKKRAKEIAASPEMIHVTCNGESIYIENINDTRNTANIHSLNNPERKKEVSLSSLVEE